jgi:predicted NBD/HSP70 family sugar kinase
VLLGERLGAGVITGRRLLRGHRGAAGEIGFIRFPGPDPATPGLEPLVPAAAAPGGDPDLVWDAADGDRRAVRALRSYGRRLADGLAPVLLALDPELVVLGTGAFPDPALLPAAELLLTAAEEHAGGLLVDPPRWRLSTLGDEAVITGAVRFALSAVESVAAHPPHQPGRPDHHVRGMRPKSRPPHGDPPGRRAECLAADRSSAGPAGDACD